MQPSLSRPVATLFAVVLTSSAASAQTAPAPYSPAVVPSPASDVPRPPARPAAGADGPVAPRITFDDAVRRALERNPTMREAMEEIRRYHALMEQVRALSLPTLYGAGTYTRLDGSRLEGSVVVQPQDNLNLDATLNVPLIYPHGWVQWGQAKDQVDVARANAADVRRTLAVATARAFLTILVQKNLLATAITARDNAKGHFDFTRAQLVGGVGNRLDEVRAAQELTTDEVNLQNQEVALFRAREALGVFVAGGGAFDVAGDELMTGMPTLNEAMNGVEKLRADVRARDRAASASERTVRDAWADYVPYLNLIGGPFYNSYPVATLPRTGWQGELVLTVPIYDGGLRYGQEHERKALADEARLNVEATLRQARSDVRTAFEELERADIALDQAHQSASFAHQALDLANLAYRSGATTNLEVIDAERQARDADTQAAIAEDASREARLDLLAASGHFP